jgi:zinc and cadmium transporter
MLEVLGLTFASLFFISLISLVGVLTLAFKVEKLKTIIIYLVSFSAGALFGDAFIHLLPEIVKTKGFSITVSFSVLFGILIFFILEKIVHWQHCHMPITKTHVHPFVYMNLLGDSLHNFIDGLIIASSYILSIPAGIATSLAVFLHEIPQEAGDFGVLIHGGFSRKRALLINFLTSLTSFLGAIVSILLSSFVGDLQEILIPLAAGGFIYIAGSDLIPELHKETETRKSVFQLISFILGILIMLLLLL